MVVPDFFLDCAGLIPGGKSSISRGNFSTSQENPVKIPVLPWQTAPKLHSSLSLCTVLYRNTHVPSAPASPHPCPAAHSCQALPACSSPAWSGTYYQFFPLVPFFFLDIPEFFLKWGNKGKNLYKRRKLTYFVIAHTECYAKASCWAAALYTILYKVL